MNKNLISKRGYFLLAFLVIFLLAYYFFAEEKDGLLLMIFIGSICIVSISEFIKSQKLLGSDKVAFINKSMYKTGMFLIPFFLLTLYKDFSDNYTLIAFLLGLLTALLHYITHRRKIIVFHPDKIEDFNDSIDKDLSRVTSFNVYENNVEIIFNNTEILQINKHELSLPNWEVFTERMIAYKKNVEEYNG
ncbi:hypothetical protein RQM59_12140 [Flavobacteriaceae bacterium S356]|uniref:MFS transporter n=1 Tax=Asprobacillus argus TaxID=3076534 RepID=A0ABU3LHF9_9FLAO|nr:hypothetical protein [Flavobacteriaceae bacterium S356]